METCHRVFVGDAREMAAVDDDAVELVVTSPPYPMVEMWDELFTDLDPAVGDRLAAGDGDGAFEAMHRTLAGVWDELERVLVDGGIACVNVGDATRTVDGEFELYPNHARVVDAFERRGFRVLPDVLWRKPTNKANKFMGSGMVPPNAYVSLEHEYILVFRNGGPRTFAANADARYESAYFWEERNDWFSDVWTDVSGADQTLADPTLRERSGAFPLSIPYRLVNMYSVYGDTVLDPFWGTGTTSLAAMAAGRNSVGYELDAAFAAAFEERVDAVPALSRRRCRRRLERHRQTVADRGEEMAYTATHYDVPVMTSQETDLRLYAVDSVAAGDDRYTATHVPFEGDATTPGQSTLDEL